MGTQSYYGITIPDPEPSGAGGALLIDALKVLAARSQGNADDIGSHTHDDRYYTETEMAAALALKSDPGHTP